MQIRPRLLHTPIRITVLCWRPLELSSGCFAKTWLTAVAEVAWETALWDFSEASIPWKLQCFEASNHGCNTRPLQYRCFRLTHNSKRKCLLVSLQHHKRPICLLNCAAESIAPASLRLQQSGAWTHSAEHPADGMHIWSTCPPRARRWPSGHRLLYILVAQASPLRHECCVQ